MINYESSQRIAATLHTLKIQLDLSETVFQVPSFRDFGAVWIIFMPWHVVHYFWPAFVPHI